VPSCPCGLIWFVVWIMQRLPEIQQLVRSLAVENENLREVIHRSSPSTLRVFRWRFCWLDSVLVWLCVQEMRDLQRACKALSKENNKLEVTSTVLVCFSCSFVSWIGMWATIWYLLVEWLIKRLSCFGLKHKLYIFYIATIRVF